MPERKRTVVTVSICSLCLGFLGLASSVAGSSQHPFLETHVLEPISNAKVLPDSTRIPSSEAESLNATACRGEYESVSFAVRALQEVKGLTVSISDFKGEREGELIPSGAVDPYLVKCWFQSGRDIHFRSERLLTPELLLKDDDLVRVDLDKKENSLRTTDASGTTVYVSVSGSDSSNLADVSPRDARELQPVDLPTGTVKQFWLRLHVPEDARPGRYAGSVRLAAEGGRAVELPFRLRVLPFKLEPPVLQYSIYYRGKLHADGSGSISSEKKSPRQYEAEMRDMKAHGVEYPTVYQGYDPDLLKQMFTLRDKAGLVKGPLYTLGIGTGSSAEPDRLAALQEGVRKWIDIAAAHGYGPVYVYGIDEATGERLKAQQKAWEAVKEAGGKVFVACYKGTFEAMGDRLGLAVFAGRPDPQEANKYHSVGSRIFCYANPQVGVEEPETYRRNFGLLLWKAGFDGAMDYAYQHSFGHVWNDFDHDQYRDHVFAYPTVDGVVDTIQWEGFREGVDDVRYLSTLLKAIEAGRRTYTPDAALAERWLEDLDPAGDLGKLREGMIEWITRLQEQTSF
jgi:hypothetical protein